MHEPHAPRGSDHRASGVKSRIGATQRRKLRAASGGIARLIEHLVASGGNLVAADHDRSGMTPGHFLGFGHRQAHRPVGWTFSGQVVFADLGTDGFEGQAEPLQQRAAVRGGRG